VKKIIPVVLSLMVSLLSIVPVIADDITVSATVSKYITATFEYSAVSFGSLGAGSNNNPAPNQATGIYNVTVDTNYAYRVSASGTDFSDGGSHTFNINNLKVDTNPTAGDLALSDAVTLSGSSQPIDTNIAPTETINYHGYWLSIPASQYPTTYSTTVTVTFANES